LYLQPEDNNDDGVSHEAIQEFWSPLSRVERRVECGSSLGN
jgi:hypothetical protein